MQIFLYIISAMIEIRDIKQPEWLLYKKSADGGPDTYLGVIKNYAQYLDVRVQINEAQECGYYLVYNGEKVKLDRNGTADHFPDNFFGDIETSLLLELI